jgi:hypothetical protein
LNRRCITGLKPFIHPKPEATMPKESTREDLDHKPENAGKVGEEHKQANQSGEQQRPPEREHPADETDDKP